MSVTLMAFPLNSSGAEVPYTLDTLDDIDIAITYTSEEYSDVTKRRGAFTKTILLPNSDTNARCFEFAFDVQSFVGGFQATKKIRASLWSDGVQVFSGVMRLLSISKVRGVITYEVALFAEDVGLFKEIEGKLLAQTVGVSGMNHMLTSGHVRNTWTSGSLSGYVYGMLDTKGYPDATQEGTFRVGFWQMLPSIYVKKMVDLIFAQAGYSYSSTFLNTAPFVNLVIPYANTEPSIILSGSNMYIGKNNTATLAANSFTWIGFTVETAPYYDNPGFWASSILTAPSLPVTWNVTVRLTNTQSVSSSFYRVRIWNITAGSGFPSNDGIAIGWLPNNSLINAVFTNFTTIPGNTYRIEVFASQTGCGLAASGYVFFECVSSDNAILQQTMDMTYALPSDVKQSDLLSDLQKMFNLYFMPEPDNPKTIRIEPWGSFYTNNVQDWSLKSDENSEIKIIPQDPNAVSNYIFKYNDRGDYLSDQYKSAFPLSTEGYGGRNYLVDNYYGKGTKEVQVLAGTLIPGQFTTDKIAGRAWQLDGTALSGTIVAQAPGYRIAHYQYVTPNTPWRLALSYSAGQYQTQSESSLPFIGHINDPYNPTVDLAFGVPRRLFYNAKDGSNNPIPYTNNNLFNAYWLDFINEISSKEALMVEVSMMLETADIAKLELRNPIFWQGIRWRVLEIRDWLAGQGKPCQVRLRRILNLTNFSAGTIGTNPGRLRTGSSNDPVPSAPTGGNGPAEFIPSVVQISLPSVTGPQGDTGDTGPQGDAGVNGNSSGFSGTWTYDFGGGAPSTQFDSDDNRWTVVTFFSINIEDNYLIDYTTFFQDLDLKFDAGWTIFVTITWEGKPENSAQFQVNDIEDQGTTFKITVDPPIVYDSSDLINDGIKYTVMFTLAAPGLPAATNDGDMAVYDGTVWNVLPAPTSGTKTLTWTTTSGVHWI
jgi:hypothetical protein